MSTSEKFKEKIKEGNLKEALIAVVSEAVELKITTYITPDNEALSSKPRQGYYIRTRMNILDGAIENEIGSEVINKQSYQEIQQFHLQQVKEGHQIVQTNLENIQKMFTLLSDSLAQLS